jgi:hypothetical protein
VCLLGAASRGRCWCCGGRLVDRCSRKWAEVSNNLAIRTDGAGWRRESSPFSRRRAPTHPELVRAVRDKVTLGDDRHAQRAACGRVGPLSIGHDPPVELVGCKQLLPLPLHGNPRPVGGLDPHEANAVRKSIRKARCLLLQLRYRLSKGHSQCTAFFFLGWRRDFIGQLQLLRNLPTHETTRGGESGACVG